MTEMSPLGTVATPRPSLRGDLDKELKIRGTQGRLMFGVEMKIVDADGKELPHDGVAQGELLVRGNAVISGYYENTRRPTQRPSTKTAGSARLETYP